MECLIEMKPAGKKLKTSQQTERKRFLSITELMLCTGLSRSTLHRQIKVGTIPAARIGSRILIPSSYLKTLEAIAEATAKEEDK